MDQRKSYRSRLVEDRTINLIEIEPLLRLKELCNQGKYTYKINWDRFQNGFMCECILYYDMKKRTKVLKKEVFWVETQDLRIAKQTIAAIMLERIGLGVEEPSQSNFEEVGTETLSGINEKKSWADMVEGD